LFILETEKFAHVTFFFNGGVEDPFELEHRDLIDSPSKVATYDLKPEMTAIEIAEKVGGNKKWQIPYGWIYRKI